MKILIAYYSRTKNTAEVAEILTKEMEGRGHTVDIEKIVPVKEHGFWAWSLIRVFKSECAIQPPKIRNLSGYDAILVGSPNWTRLSLPVMAYLRRAEGLKYKKVGFFATTAMWPNFEWYILSAYLLDFTSSRIIDKKRGNVVATALLSSWFKDWGCNSEYGKRALKNLCNQIESPVCATKNCILGQGEIAGIRLFIIVYLALWFFSLILQLLLFVLKTPIFSWYQYSALFTIGLAANLTLLIAMSRKKELTLARYIASICLILGWTLVLSFVAPAFFNLTTVGYILLFIFFTAFRDGKMILFNGLVTVSCYGLLYLAYPLRDVLLNPSLDLSIILLTTGAVSFITQTLRNHYVSSLEAREELESAKTSLEITITERTKELQELAASLDIRVQERTKELQDKLEELEKFHKLVVGRELKMAALKEEIDRLQEELKKLRGE